MTPRSPHVRTKRVYEPGATEDGARVLIMRLWPRGIRRAHVDLWLKELGPIVPLLRDYLDGRISWDEYVPRYLAGLDRPEARQALATVRGLQRSGPVTLLCGCADEARCHRSLLATVLARPPERGGPGIARRKATRRAPGGPRG